MVRIVVAGERRPASATSPPNGNERFRLGAKIASNPFERPGISKGRGRKHHVPLTEDDLDNLYASCDALGSYADEFRGSARSLAASVAAVVATSPRPNLPTPKG